MEEQRLWIWFRDNTPYRCTNDLLDWSGSILEARDVIREVYLTEDSHREAIRKQVVKDVAEQMRADAILKG